MTYGNHCPGCDGTGIKSYGCTSTWRGGAGGSAMTSDVCDTCWGTGNRQRPGINLRQHEADMRELAKLRANNLSTGGE